MALIAVIEDEPDLLELLEYHLQKEGYEVFAALSTGPIEKLLEEEPPDLMLVDRDLPGVEGSEFVARLRREGYDMPVIFLTAKGSETEVEEGFERGADDYVTKPFHFKELMHRVRAVLRRVRPQDSQSVRFRDILVKPRTREVFIGGEPVALTKREFDLLLTLIGSKGVVLSREDLLERVWGDDEGVQVKTVNVAMNRLKEKIDPQKSKGYIQSVRGVGYRVC
jgi:DNA-binding response OmpR family regulator